MCTGLIKWVLGTPFSTYILIHYFSLSLSAGITVLPFLLGWASSPWLSDILHIPRNWTYLFPCNYFGGSPDTSTSCLGKDVYQIEVCCWYVCLGWPGNHCCWLSQTESCQQDWWKSEDHERSSSGHPSDKDVWVGTCFSENDQFLKKVRVIQSAATFLTVKLIIIILVFKERS